MTSASDYEAMDFSPYQIHSRREIITLLRTLKERGQLVSLLINGGAETVITSILDIDDTDDTVIVDCAPSNLLNERIINSDNISFESFLDHIRILFFASSIEACSFEDRPALRFALPASMIRLQRREYYRVATSVANQVRCVITIPNDHGTENATVSTYLQNISAGGVALVDESKTLDNTIGLIYKNCRIDLPGGTPISTQLQVKNSQELTFTNGRAIRRLGCAFIDLPTPLLAAVQRYITRLEREQNARTTGMI